MPWPGWSFQGPSHQQVCHLNPERKEAKRNELKLAATLNYHFFEGQGIS